MKLNADKLLLQALKEDITSEDVSANAVIGEDVCGTAELICKQDGVICGLPVFERVFLLLDESAHFETDFKDGDFVKAGAVIGKIYGNLRALLSGERTALNYLQRMSGIATMTHEYAQVIKGMHTVLLDTRKTTPNMRLFEKYAVRIGGGRNHRYNLSDGVLLKDNHISSAGSVAKAVAMARDYAPFVRKIEVETETLAQVREAADAGADIIMLDNMDLETMKEALAIIAGRAQTECSGNVTKERLLEIAEIGVDFVSSGALTHSAPIMDLSLKNMKSTAK
ncbi:MAG: carboxylating nicotinate-nucleotide diphosphorylase [Clostridiales bacterium]|nr:carboxylating nicotinate-nucleotide diphosphorylase [Clostridiales bacterium]